MTFADLQGGDTVFVDANVLIYQFTNHPRYGAACTALVEADRLIWHGEVESMVSRLPGR